MSDGSGNHVGSEWMGHTQDHLQLCSLNGVPVLAETKNNWKKISEFQARPDDLLIATYYKSGTTWMQELVDQILNGGDMEKCQRAPIYNRIPFLELSFPPPPPLGVEVIEGMASPRVIKTHLRADLLPQSFWEQKCKMIYVARNIKDVIVSNYYFHRMSLFLPKPGTWEQFLQKSLAGEVLWGSWFEHVKEWWSRREKADILFVFYEDMKEDLAHETDRVASFLDRKLSPEQIASVVRNTTFETMRENPMTNYTTIKETIWNMNISPFMRKGEVGDWKHHFTVAQNELLDQLITEHLKDTFLNFRYDVSRIQRTTNIQSDNQRRKQCCFSRQFQVSSHKMNSMVEALKSDTNRALTSSALALI